MAILYLDDRQLCHVDSETARLIAQLIDQSLLRSGSIQTNPALSFTAPEAKEPADPDPLKIGGGFSASMPRSKTQQAHLELSISFEVPSNLRLNFGPFQT